MKFFICWLLGFYGKQPSISQYENDLSHLRSDFGPDFNIEAHLIVKSEPKLDLKFWSCRYLCIGGHFCTVTSEAVFHKILATSTQMCLNGEVRIKIGHL